MSILLCIFVAKKYKGTIMKRTILAVLCCLFGMLVGAQETKMYLVTDNPIAYDNSQFYLGWSSHPIPGYYIQEYFVKGESPEGFNRMFTICLYDTDITPEEGVKQKIDELEKRKKSDRLCNYQMYNKGDEYILDFLVSNASEGNLSVAEWNLYYYKKVKIGLKSYLRLSFFSKRAYGDDIISFLKAIPDLRGERIIELSEMNLKIKAISQQ